MTERKVLQARGAAQGKVERVRFLCATYSESLTLLIMSI